MEPELNEYLVEDNFPYSISFNGIRFVLEFPSDTTCRDRRGRAQPSRLAKVDEGKTPKKVVCTQEDY